jgi:phosphoglucosamine mutase
MLRSNMSLYELSRGMKKFPQTLINVRFSEGADPTAHSLVKQAVLDAEKGLSDSGRVLLRKSGTEPLIRVMVEAVKAEDSSSWAEHIAEAVRKVTA